MSHTKQEIFYSLFFPYAWKNQTRLQKEKTPLVHYTNADAAAKIIGKKRIWLRESSCMNDYSEMQHGYDCLVRAYKAPTGQRFQKALNDIFPDVTKEIAKRFDSWSPHFRHDTYLACFSEHDEKKEGAYGRLSMWRAYSQSTGIAIVMNNDVFFNESDYFEGLYTSPVAYLDSVDDQILEITKSIENNLSFMKTLSIEEVIEGVFRMFMFASSCTKHPGFEEEREWRLTYCPTFESTPNLEKQIETIRGIPQIVYKIPLEPVPESGLSDLCLDKLIKAIIIGPTEYPVAMSKSFIKLLGDAGVSEPEKRIIVSGIPLR